MISILRVEFFRLIKSKLFWILMGVCFALPIFLSLFIVGFIGILDNIANDLPEFADLSYMLHSIGMTSSTLAELPSIASNVSLLSLICTSVILSKEFTDGTVRNAILANKNRRQLYFAYLIISLIIGAVYTLTFFFSTLIFVLPIFGFGGLSASDAVAACFSSLGLGLFAVLFVQTCVTMFLFAVRKQWATVLFPILICRFVPSIFAGIVALLTFGESIQGGTLSETVTSWIPFVNASYFNPSAIDGALIGKIIMYYLIFSAVFMISGYFTFEKSDLK